MKYFYMFLFLLISSAEVFAADVNFRRKKPITCFEFVDLYAKIIENADDPTMEDQKNFDLAVERITGYISGIEAGTSTRIVMQGKGITELSILSDINRSCIVAPDITLDEAILSLSIINAVIKNAASRNAKVDAEACASYCENNY